MPEDFAGKALQEQDLHWAVQKLAAAQARKWHGTFHITFYDGQIKQVITEHSEHPPSRGSHKAQ